MSIPLINGRAYSYVDITFVALGVALPSVSAINYTQEQPKENHHGTGNEPVSRGRGPKNATASFDISMNDTEALRDVAPNGSLLDIPPFDIVVVFGNPQSPRTHVIKNFEFSDDGVESTTGDTDIKRTFSGTPSHIKYR
jgi:hypothetical protein